MHPTNDTVMGEWQENYGSMHGRGSTILSPVVMGDGEQVAGGRGAEGGYRDGGQGEGGGNLNGVISSANLKQNVFTAGSKIY